ncbi:Protein spinster 3 [Aphanomyces cochlioides]|nr:Protein spinster 3 [Aphanomyces cochlioides]
MQAKHDAAAPVWIFMLFCLINFANYFDRNIIPGAPAQFQYFIQTVTSSNDMGTLLGLLTSSFIMSFTISIPLFGCLAMFVQPFRLVAIGLAVCLSKDAQSFELLLAGRILSGVGEASFQCVAPPFIHEYAPPHQQTLWFGIFSVSSVLGGTFGGIAASTMASSTLGWSALFAIEGIAMLPFVGVCLYGVPAMYNTVPPSETTGETQRLLSSTETKPTFWAESDIFKKILPGTIISIFSNTFLYCRFGPKLEI